jgi:serine/threonine protein kinase
VVHASASCLPQQGQVPPPPQVDLGVCRMAEFSVERVIGTGSFGRVSVGKHKKTGVTVAIKALSKAAMIKNGQVRDCVGPEGLAADCGR